MKGFIEGFISGSWKGALIGCVYGILIASINKCYKDGNIGAVIAITTIMVSFTLGLVAIIISSTINSKIFSSVVVPLLALAWARAL